MMENTCKTRIVPPSRSQGDGMENTSFEMDPPKHCIDNYRKHFVPTQGKTKEPKFVPYEPYKAAVSPILPHRLDNKADDRSPFVIDSQRVSSLASSIIRVYSSMEVGSKDQERKCHSDCGDRIQKLEDRILALEKEKKEIMSQYQVQAEVNNDLKKMLVASLGEDVQLRVQFMTEDKAALGKEVLRLSEELDSALEERERRDVWESKFKASSLMVKELAHWKSFLSQMVNQSAASLDQLMQEHESMFEMLSSAHSKLESSLSTAESNPRRDTKASKTISQMSVEIASLSSKVQERFLGRPFCDTNSKHVRKFTRAENSANQFLRSFKEMGIAGLPDRPTSCQVQDCSMDTSVNFCKHCSGEVKLL